MKKTFKNITKHEFPFSKIPPGKTKTVEIIGSDDIHFAAVKQGFLKEVKEIAKEKKTEPKTKKRSKKKKR